MNPNYIESSSKFCSLDETSRYGIYEFKRSIYNELKERSYGFANISNVYKNLLKFFIATFSSINYIDDQENLNKVPCWHGNSERVIAKIKQESNLVLPVMSIFRVRDELDNTRRREEGNIIYESYYDNIQERAVRVASLPSVATKMTYKLSLWSKYQEDMDQMSEQIRKLFNPHLLIKTVDNFTSVAFLSEEESNSEKVIPDGQDRILKKSIDIVTEFYIPNPKFVITNTGKIESLNTEVCFPI